MGALGLLAETLVSEPDPQVAQRLAGRIHNEAFRVSRIIDDLLDLSRIESEEAPPREPVLVNLVMADAIERVRATADQRGIEIVLHEPSPPVAVMGDRRQLVSAMHALLENAITYSYDDSKVVVSGMVQRVNPNLSHPALHGEGAGEDERDRLSFDTGEVILADKYAVRSEVDDGVEADVDGDGDAGRAADDGAEVVDSVAAVDAGAVEESTPVTPAHGTKVDDGDGAVEPVFTPEILENFTVPAETPAAAGTTVPPVTSGAGPAGAPEGSETVAMTETTSSIPNWRIEERDNVRIAVQDHGVGIPARDLDRIFERFYRVDHGRSRDTGGTGLGLSIVRHVANNHQGWVDVESREGEGSTFTLVLPVQGQGERIV
jgi:signal transduction histidine kinase